MKSIYFFGECMVELMANSSVQPANKFSQSMTQSFAGDVFNTAVYLKRTFGDFDVNLVTAVGKDSFSDTMLKYFSDEKINTDYVFQSSARLPGLYSIQLDKHGERSFSYWRENSAAKEVMEYIDQTFINNVSANDVVFFSGISLAVIFPNDRPKFWALIQTLKEAGTTVVFDPNYRARMWDSPEQAKEQFEMAYNLADVMLPGVDDFEQLYGLTTSEEVYEFCKPYQFEELVIKNGEQGIYCFSEGQSYHFDITPVENVVDTTSAGDSFNGVYLGARAHNYNVSHSVDMASKAAGFVIQHKGAIVDKQIFSEFVKTL